MMPRKPNILFIMTDQQAPDMMSCTGNEWLRTPALDSLAEEGTRFEHAICANPVCVPSRMSMATGRVPRHLGAMNNSGRHATIDGAVAANSLGLLMRSAGYVTFYGGKSHMCPQLDPRRAGYFYHRQEDRDSLADRCIEFISRRRNKPFFAVASFMNPHDICYAHNAKVNRTPRLDWVTELYHQAAALPDRALPPLPDNFLVPEHEPVGLSVRENHESITPVGAMSATYSERDWRIYRWIYARLMEQVDQHIARILAALKRNRLERNTLVVFASDHGNMHGHHRLASKNVFYEEAVRVPLILKWAGEIPAGHVNRTHLVNTGLDILPTLCDYAKIDVPEGLIGISQRAAAEQRPNAPAHSHVFSEFVTGRMVRDTRWKYTIYRGDQPREILTDLRDDPGEMNNLALDPAHEQRLNEYRRRMREWLESTDDTEGLREFTVG